MKNQVIHIKNMVCPRCIETVMEILNELNIETSSVQLGEVNVLIPISGSQKSKLGEKLEIRGFELLEDNKSKLISKIKSIIVSQIHHTKEELIVNFSTLLADNLNHEYTSLSRLFSSVEGITIERFVLKQKIEKVKELIIYKELTFSEIAYQMNYSSIAHLSTQFKKETGMTPTQFKGQSKPSRQSLDRL